MYLKCWDWKAYCECELVWTSLFNQILPATLHKLQICLINTFQLMTECFPVIPACLSNWCTNVSFTACKSNIDSDINQKHIIWSCLLDIFYVTLLYTFKFYSVTVKMKNELTLQFCICRLNELLLGKCLCLSMQNAFDLWCKRNIP